MLTADLLVLGVLGSAAALGAYGIALRIPQFLVGAALLVQTAVLPTITRALATGDRGRAALMQADAIRAALGVTVTGAVCLSLGARPLLVTLFSPTFAASVPLFAVLVWKVPLVAASGLARNVLLARAPAAEAAAAAQGLVLTVAAVIAGTLAFGPIGAAWAIVFGEGALLALYARRSRVLVGSLPVFDRTWLLRMAVCCGAGALVCWFLPAGHPFLAIAIMMTAWITTALAANWPYAARLRAEMAAAPPSPTSIAESLDV